MKQKRFQVRDLVLGKVLQNKGVLDPNWEGLNRIVEVLSPGAYKVVYLSGEHISRCWNTDHLGTYYQ